MIAVPDRVILQHELAGEWSIGVQRYRRGSIQLLVAECPYGCCRHSAVVVEQIERLLPGYSLVRLGMPRIDLVDLIPRHARHGLPGGELLGQLNLQRVHRGDVMHHNPDLAAIVRDAALPLVVGEATRHGRELTFEFAGSARM